MAHYLSRTGVEEMKVCSVTLVPAEIQDIAAEIAGGGWESIMSLGSIRFQAIILTDLAVFNSARCLY